MSNIVVFLKEGDFYISLHKDRGGAAVAVVPINYNSNGKYSVGNKKRFDISDEDTFDGICIKAHLESDALDIKVTIHSVIRQITSIELHNYLKDGLDEAYLEDDKNRYFSEHSDYPISQHSKEFAKGWDDFVNTVLGFITSDDYTISMPVYDIKSSDMSEGDESTLIEDLSDYILSNHSFISSESGYGAFQGMTEAFSNTLRLLDTYKG